MSIETESFESAVKDHLENCAKYEQLMRTARTISANCFVPANDRAGLEMIAADLGVDSISAEGLVEMVKSAATAMRASLNRVLETVAIWADKTGKKEAARLRRRVEELQGEPATKQISDRSLADNLSIDGRMVTDHTATADDVRQISYAFLDEYFPDVAHRDYEIWRLMDKGGLLGWRGRPDNIHSVLVDILSFLVTNKEPTVPLKDQGTDIVIGDRSVFKKSPLVGEPSFTKLNGDSDAQTLIKRYVADKRVVRGRREIKRGSSVARVGVVPVLSPTEMNETLDAMSKICDTLERTVAIRKQTRSETATLSEMRVLVEAFNTSEIVNVLQADGSSTQREIFALDEADRQRVDLIVRYVSRDLYDTARILLVLTDMQMGVWGAMRDHVRASLDSYRSP